MSQGEDLPELLRNVWKAGCRETCTSGLGLGPGCNSPAYTTRHGIVVISNKGPGYTFMEQHYGPDSGPLLMSRKWECGRTSEAGEHVRITASCGSVRQLLMRHCSRTNTSLAAGEEGVATVV